MSTSLAQTIIPTTLKPLAGTQRLLRATLFARLRSIQCGQLIIADAMGRETFGARPAPGLDAAASTDQETPRVTVYVSDPRAYRMVALDGDIGVAESYMAGYWSCDDLVALFRLFTRNIALSDRIGGQHTRITKMRHRIDHWLRKNTRLGSRRNIRAHYDVGNDFFALFLDDTMTYSCAIFDTPETPLYDASVQKLDHICKKLALGPDDHLLEIGTGWGSLAIHAAKYYGCRVTTTTISSQQYAMATARIAEAGLSERIQPLLRDYRDLSGQYDKLVSVEMIEAVGHEYYEQFFRICSQCLAPDGLMLIQAITIPDQRYENARRDVDVIRHLIFPGSVIPSATAILHATTQASDMRLYHFEDITPHYAQTLAHWRRRFLERHDQALELGYEQEFLRLWDYYLASCQAAFAERYLGDVQMLFAKPQSQPVSIRSRFPA